MELKRCTVIIIIIIIVVVVVHTLVLSTYKLLKYCKGVDTIHCSVDCMTCVDSMYVGQTHRCCRYIEPRGRAR